MTKKHFIKFLMSKGLPRNKAVFEANKFRKSGIPYKKAVKCFEFQLLDLIYLKEFVYHQVLPLKKGIEEKLTDIFKDLDPNSKCENSEGEI